MKRHVLAFGLVLVAGCGGGSTEPDGDNDPPGGSVKVFTATINGAAYTGVNIVGAYSSGTLSITSQDAQSRVITITATGLTGTGQFSVSFGNQGGRLVQMVDPGVGLFSTSYLGGSGTVTLTTATLSRVTGTFSFIAYTSAGTGAGNRVVTVQNGSFDISNP